MSPAEPYIPTHLREAVAAERAAADLRRGLPAVVLSAERALAVLPAELADPPRLARIREIGRPVLLLTRERAAVLKIRHKGRDAVRTLCPPDMSCSAIRSAADPASDLACPMKGPFAVEDRPDCALEAAALRLVKRARLLPAALAVDLPGGAEASAWAEAQGLLAVDCGAVADMEAEPGLEIVARARLPLAAAPDTRVVAFRPPAGGAEHFALVIGDPLPHEPALVRLHSECFTGDALGSLKCDCGAQFAGALEAIATAGGGILLYLAQEGRGIGLIAKLKAYALQDEGFDTVDANLRLGFAADERIYKPAAIMLKTLGFSSVRLLTNNPEKVAALEAEGIAVVERVALACAETTHNAHYLAAKRDRSGHIL